MTYFQELINKEGETLQRYVHTFESSRDSVTNLKESQYAAAVNITAIVRSQPENTLEVALGIVEGEAIVILTTTQVAENDVIKWQNKYWDVLMVEDMYFRKSLDYYKCTCVRRIEFLGA